MEMEPAFPWDTSKRPKYSICMKIVNIIYCENRNSLSESYTILYKYRRAVKNMISSSLNVPFTR